MGLVHKDKVFTWVRYREGLCRGCTAACCTMPVEVKASDLVRLGLILPEEHEESPRKVLAKLSKQGWVKSYRASTDVYMLQQMSNDDCVFLGADRLCRVYDKRPDVCRKFPRVGLRPGFCPASSQSKTR
jgi:Fe-S-cluster containining protein